MEAHGRQLLTKGHSKGSAVYCVRKAISGKQKAQFQKSK